MDDTTNKTPATLTRDQLNKSRNSVKARFMPRSGALLRMPNGIVYRVVFSNVGQLRFTAMFDCVVDMKILEERGFSEPIPEELMTA